jgi:DNA-binding SARP family transcriptional activator
MARLELVLLGRPQLRSGGRDLAPDIGAKSLALLALLARSAPQPITRERIAGTLWSDKREQAARYRLRHTLWELRRSLDVDLIQSDQNACWIDLTIGITIDLVEFQQGCEQIGIGTRQPSATPDLVPTLAQLAVHYGGDLLSDLTVREAPLFEEWLLSERERLRLLCQDVLWNLARAQQAANAPTDAAQTLTRLIAVDPLRERNYRALMAIYVAQNDKAAALKVYAQCREILSSELGTQPSKDTERLHEIILHERGDSARREFDRANALFQQGKFDDALAACRAADLLFPDSLAASEIALLRAQIALAQGNSGEVSSFLQIARQTLRNLAGGGG